MDSSDQKHPESHYTYCGLKALRNISCQTEEQIQKQIESIKWQRSNEKTGFFTGGWLSYLSYESFSKAKSQENHYPLASFAYFESLLVLDHIQKKTFLVSEMLSQEELLQKKEEWMTFFDNLEDKSREGILSTSQSENIQKQISFSDYEKKIHKIKDYLKAGDVYQINLTHRFEFESQKSSVEIYKNLREISPVPYGLYVNWGNFQILSSSPESFLEIDGDRIRTRPIKGTCSRLPKKEGDEKQMEKLQNSSKDAAEHLMIVDLERNDLGKICEFGTVSLEKFRELQSFAQVHHLVSTVSGKLKKDIKLFDILKALFPGGSITGAPKKRAMEIIHELEDFPRGIYTGALGFISDNGLVKMNLPIRTIIQNGSQVVFNSGGGIVIDSEARSEYEELLLKASGMLEALK